MRTLQNKDEMTDIISRLAGKLIKTPGLFPLVSAIVSDLLNEWSANSKIKKAVAFPVKKILPGEARDEVQPQTSVAADVGKLLTLLSISVNEERAMHEGGNGKVRGEAVVDFLVNTDFGELLEVVEKSEDGVKPMMEAFNKALWTYPTKFGCIAAMLGPLYRMVIKLLTEFLAPIKDDVGPDLLGDIIMTLLRDSDSESLVKLIDSVNELIRRIHTGSLLIGMGDISKLDMYLDDLIKVYHGTKDVYLQKMMPIYFGEIRESIANASSRSLTDNQDIFLAQIASLGQAKSSEIRVKNARLRVYEAADQEKLGEVMSENAKDFDTYEAAGLINSLCGVLNKIHDTKPGLIGNLITSVVDSVSADEVSRTAEWLIPDVVNAVKPMATAIMPELLKGLSELIRGDGYPDEKYHEAVREFREALSAVGGAA